MSLGESASWVVLLFLPKGTVQRGRAGLVYYHGSFCPPQVMGSTVHPVSLVKTWWKWRKLA